MFYVEETPWHGLGKEVPEAKKLSIDEAIVAAGLDWEVDLRCLYTEDGQTLLNMAERHAVCRQKDNTVLGIVGPDDYTPFKIKKPSHGSRLSLIPAKPPLKLPAKSVPAKPLGTVNISRGIREIVPKARYNSPQLCDRHR